MSMSFVMAFERRSLCMNFTWPMSHDQTFFQCIPKNSLSVVCMDSQTSPWKNTVLIKSRFASTIFQHKEINKRVLLKNVMHVLQNTKAFSRFPFIWVVRHKKLSPWRCNSVPWSCKGKMGTRLLIDVACFLGSFCRRILFGIHVESFTINVGQMNKWPRTRKQN